MSGEKDTFVQLRQSEYRRMMDACRRVGDVERTSQQLLRERGWQEQLQRDLQERMSAVDHRQREQQRRVEGLGEEMRRIESAYNQRLHEQTKEFQQGIASLGEELRGQRREYLSLIQEQEQKFTSAMAVQRRELEAQIAGLRDDLAAREDLQREQAERWLADTRSLLDLLAREYRHEKFKPGAVERLRTELSLTEGNISQGNHQAAIAAAQQSYLRGQDLRQELERLELEWNAYLAGAQRSAAEVLATCEAQETCRFTLETEEGAEEVAGEVNFWTEGALSALRHQVEEEFKQLNSPVDLTLDELKSSIRQSQIWREECLSLTEIAKEALIASQLRNNMAQTIEAALAGAGWEVTDSTYEGEDFRRALHIKLQSLGGDEMVSVIRPEATEGTLRNRLNIAFYDRSTNDEAYRLRRLDAVTQTLREDGLECSTPQCVPGTEQQAMAEPQRLDFERVRKAATPRTKQQETH